MNLGISSQTLRVPFDARHSRPFRGASTPRRPIIESAPLRPSSTPQSPEPSISPSQVKNLSSNQNLNLNLKDFLEEPKTILTLVEKKGSPPDFEAISWETVTQVAAVALGALAVGYSLYCLMPNS